MLFVSSRRPILIKELQCPKLYVKRTTRNNTDAEYWDKKETGAFRERLEQLTVVAAEILIKARK